MLNCYSATTVKDHSSALAAESGGKGKGIGACSGYREALRKGDCWNFSALSIALGFPIVEVVDGQPLAFLHPPNKCIQEVANGGQAELRLRTLEARRGRPELGSP